MAPTKQKKIQRNIITTTVVAKREIKHKHPLNYIARIDMTNKEVNNKGELIYQHTQFWTKSMTVHHLPRTTLNTATAGSGYGRTESLSKDVVLNGSNKAVATYPE